MNLVDKTCNAIEGAIVKLHDEKASNLVHGQVPEPNYKTEIAYLRALRDVQDLIKRVKAKLHED